MMVMGISAKVARTWSTSAAALSAAISPRNCVKYLPTGVSTSTVRYSARKSSPRSWYARMVFMTAGSSMPSGWQPSTTASMSTVALLVAALMRSRMLSIMYS